MPMDGLFIHHVVKELSTLLVGGKIDKINGPERDEVNLQIRNNGQTYILLISSNAACARLHITEKKKQNPLEPSQFLMLLRKHLTGGRIVGIEQVNADRIVNIHIERIDELGDSGIKTLVFECMGKHSNITLINEEGRIIDAARHITDTLSRVREILPGLKYEYPPRHNKLNFTSLNEHDVTAALLDRHGEISKELGQIISGLSPVTAREIAYMLCGNDTARIDEISFGIAAPCVEAVNSLLMPSCPQTVIRDNKPTDICPVPYQIYKDDELKTYETLSRALDEYYDEKDRHERVREKSAALLNVLKNNIDRVGKKLQIHLEAIESAKGLEDLRVYGELISAQPHLIKKGAKSVKLVNYYVEDCPEIEVKLDEALNPQQNAQKYFKRYRKLKIAARLALEQSKQDKEELNYLEGQLDNLTKCTDEPELNEIREELRSFGYVRANHNRRQMKAVKESKPLRFTALDGTIILVGKNNLQNDKLTFSADPDEYWLHVKDMPGSHVIVMGNSPTEETLLFAASLAAGFSKGREQTKCAVDMTRRKYVKKPSGAKPGFVTYTNQKTILVEPYRQQ